MRHLFLVSVVLLSYLAVGPGAAEACRFTPLEWQQPVEQHAIATLVGQRKHTTWVRDRNRNFIDDEIEARFRPGEIVNVVVDFNTCLTPSQIRETVSKFGRITYISKLVTFALLEDVRVDDLRKLAGLPQVAMVEWQAPIQIFNDVSARAVQARASNTFSPNTAQDAGFTGAGVNIAIIDTGVDDNHEAFAGKFVAGFDATIFEDTNANGVDDSCEPAPVGNGVCTDATDEPANGTTNPPDNNSHGTHVAGIALGAGTAGRVCSNPNDGSATNCAGVASGAGLVDIRVFGGANVNADVSEALDWLGINALALNIRVANMSLGACTNDDGTSALSQQVNYVVSLGVVAAVALGNAVGGACGGPGTQMVASPGTASSAITVAAVNDQDTVARNDDTNYTLFLRGPRSDFNLVTPNLLALKPDISAPGENIFSAQRNTISNYFSQSGTSMATPHVAGAAALIRQARPAIDPGSLKDLLKTNADTTLNVAQFPAVDPVWDNDLGAGMLNLWPAISTAAATDVGFPNCIGPPASPGQPCALTPPMPPWNNTADITTGVLQVGVATTITAQVRNNGAAQATVLVNFGVYVFAVGNNQFFHIGTQQVTIAPGATVAVNQPWTPAAANHQCVQVSIDFGLDTNFDNNVTQRNLQVAPSVFTVQVENPFMVPARLQLQVKADRDGWQCRVSEDSFTLNPFTDCPRQVRVTFDPPPGARPGDRANCDLAVYATPRGAEGPRLIGGVTVQTFVPRPCRLVGIVLDSKGEPVRRARLVFSRQRIGVDTREAPRVQPTTVLTDGDGVFSVQVTPHVAQEVTVERAGVGRGQLVVRPTCGVGTLKFVLGQEGLRVVEKRDP